MVTFSCEVCNESMLKKKADQHTQRCRGAYFTCIDCSTTFNDGEYRGHTQCITEDEKYQKGLYRGKKKQGQQQQQKPKPQQPKQEVKEEPKKEPKKETKPKDKKVSKPDLSKHNGDSLYKIIKKLSKDDKKQLLKSIKISNGKLVI